MAFSIKIMGLMPDKIAKRMINDKLKRFANNELYRMCDPFTPMDSGMLSKNVTVTSEYIHYKSPYAHKVYAGKQYRFRTEKHPLATGEWDKVAMVSKKKQLIQAINKAKGGLLG